MINYGPEENYIIRPAQEMDIQVFPNNDILRQAYVTFKALKTVLGVEVKSYLAKKIFLLPEFKQKAETGLIPTDLFAREQNWHEILYDILNHPELKRSFEDKIDFEKWKKEEGFRGFPHSIIPLKEI